MSRGHEQRDIFHIYLDNYIFLDNIQLSVDQHCVDCSCVDLGCLLILNGWITFSLSNELGPMENPFSYSGIVTGAAFCNRKAELADLTRRVFDSQNILLYAHRRTGKSSLIHNLIISQEFESQIQRYKKRHGIGIKAAVIDLYGTLSESDFITALFQGISKFEKNFDKLMSLIQGIRFIVGTDPVSGLPTITPNFTSREAPEYLEHVMQICESYSQKNKLLIVFDEFQEVGKYAEQGFEKRLRKEIQRHSNISYLFCGSKHHILEIMFNSPDRAFYKLARNFRLKPIALSHYKAWALDLFEQKGKALPVKVIESIVKRCEQHPAYVQQFLSELWYMDKINLAAVDEIEESLLRENQPTFIKEWDTLTVNQRKTLKLIVTTDGKGMFTTENLQSVGFSSPGMLTRTLKSLVEKDIIRKNDTYKLQDPIFKKWLMVLSSRFRVV